MTQVAREDTEVWLAWGTPTGEALAHAVATVVDTLGPEVPRPTLDDSSPMDRKPLLAGGILAVIDTVLLFDGLSSSKSGTIVLGAVTLLFFGGGGLVRRALPQRPVVRRDQLKRRWGTGFPAPHLGRVSQVSTVARTCPVECPQ